MQHLITGALKRALRTFILAGKSPTRNCIPPELLLRLQIPFAGRHADSCSTHAMCRGASGYPVHSANRARLRYRHLSFRPSVAPCRNLIFSVTCLSQGDSGLPLRGNRNDGSGVGMCCGHVVWLKKCYRAGLSG